MMIILWVLAIASFGWLVVSLPVGIPALIKGEITFYNDTVWIDIATLTYLIGFIVYLIL